MKIIKYNGYADTIDVYIDKLRMFFPFKRNHWKEVKDEVAGELLKDPHWISKDDYIVDLSKLSSSKRIGLFRFGAMGDLIQLIPVARFIKKEYKHTIILITQACYVDFFKRVPDAFDEVYPNDSHHRDKYDKLVYLDGVLEMDHSTVNREAFLHRIKIYEEYFNINVDNYDFSMNLDQKDKDYIEDMINAFIQQNQSSTDS